MARRTSHMYAAIEHTGRTVMRTGLDGEAWASANVSDGTGGALSGEIRVREFAPGKYLFTAWQHDSGKLPQKRAEWTVEVPHRLTPTT